MAYDLLFLAISSFFAGALTLFTGFGLATLLLPVFSIFLPIPVAIAATAFVHLLNNSYKLIIFFQNIDWNIFIRFGINASIAAVMGSLTLDWLSNQDYNLKTIIGIIIILIVLFEISPLRQIEINKKYIPLGGLISGFFGGLSGHQGMFRSIFLIKTGLETKKFIATGVSIAVLVDISRILIYGKTIFNYSLDNFIQFIAPVGIATLGAIFGVWLASDLVVKMHIKLVSNLISLFMVIIGLLLTLQVI